MPTSSTQDATVDRLSLEEISILVASIENEVAGELPSRYPRLHRRRAAAIDRLLAPSDDQS